MAILNANIAEAQINFPKDGIICQKYIAGIPGGRALLVENYPLSVIYAGTPVIKSSTTGDYKPFPLVQETEALPTAAVSAQTAGSAIVGTVYAGVTKETTGAVKCAKSDKTIVYLAAEAATGNAELGVTYYTKDTVSTTDVEVYDEDGNAVYELGSLPANHVYAGILYKSIKVKNPAAAIMTEGQVNLEAVYFSLASILSAFKTACPLLEFISDEEAK